MIQPPTACLPPIASIATFTNTQLSDALQYLHSFCLPQVRGARRRLGRHDERSHDDDQLQFDAFERAHAIRWLTALIAQLEALQDLSSPIQTGIDTDHLIQQAAALLASCAGIAGAGTVQRQFTFISPRAREIHVVLTDIPLDNHDYASVGAQTWGGACVLADMIAEHPDRFGLGSPLGRAHQRPLRILELGAGTGLVGLTVGKLLQALLPHSNPRLNATVHHRAIVILTDFYPAVLANLQSNIDANFTAIDNDIVVHSHFLDWSSFSTTEPKPDILSTPFDLIFGADIAYEAQHAVWIHDSLKSLLARPDGSVEQPMFHLVIPLRPTHTFESDMVEEVFGAKDNVSQPRLAIFSKESIVCEAYEYGRLERSRMDNDVEYVYYRIGWQQ